MRYNLIYILFSLFIFPDVFCENLNNTTFTYQYLTTKEGLSSQRVFSIEKDRNGFIWIGTRAGIDCYDGKEIKRHKLFNEDIIADDLGRNIYLVKSPKSEIWAYTNSGKIFRYSDDADTFVLELDLAEKMINDLHLNYLYIDDNGDLWLALKKGLFFCKRGEDNISIKQIIVDKSVNSLHYARSINRLYASCVEGVFEVNLNDKIGKTQVTAFAKGINIQTSFYDEQTSLLWVGTFHLGMMVINTHSGKSLDNPNISKLPQLPYRSIIVNDQNTLLLGIDGAGVYSVNRRTFANELFLSAGKENKGPLNGNGVYAINKDEAGNLWIGTYTGGVTLANPKDLSFDLIQHEHNNNQSLVDNHVNAIFEDTDGDIWYGTNQGVSVFFSREKTWRHYLSNQVVLTLCNDKANNVWAGGYGIGLYCIDKHKGAIRHISSSTPNTLTTDYIYSIFRDADDNFWIGGTFGKLVQFTPGGNSSGDNYKYYDIDLINSITEMNADTLAIATVNGFYLLNRNTGNFMHYFSSPEVAGTRSNSFIYSLFFESPQILWFGTDGGGLNRFNMQALKAETFSTAHGLPSNYIYGILPDKQQRLWISTDKGLAIIDLKDNNRITNMGLIDKVDEFNFMAFASLKNHDLMFGSTSGAIRFNPDEINFQKYKSKLFFTSLEYSTKSGYKNVLKSILNETKEIDLRYNENSFLISFVSLSYDNQKDIAYSYLLEGFDNEWSKQTSDLSVRYTNVPPGEYTFRIKSFSKVGGYELDERILTINVSQPFWNTIWAWMLYFITAIGVTYFVWRFFAEKMEKRYFSEKIDFFVNTAHDIRTPVTLIMAPLNDLDKEEGLSANGQNYLNIARKNTDKLFKLITQLLDFEKSETNKLSLKIAKYELNSYLSEVAVTFSPLCSNKNIKLSLSLPDKEIEVWFDKDKIDKVMDNLVSNAIKYTPENGEVSIVLKETDKKIVIEISDNGIGIPQSAQKHIFSNFYRAQNAINSTVIGSGIGLLLTRKLVRLHKGKIFFDSAEGKGSVFSLALKKGNKHYPKHALVEDVVSIAEKEISSSLVADDGAEARKNKSKPSLMIVEDNDELRFYLKKSFEKDYNVVAKSNGGSALAYFEKDFVDIIVSDVMMPGMSGYELCNRLKDNINTSHIPIILLTAKAEKSSVMEGLQCGANDYLTKPFDTDVLRLKLENMLGSRKVLREHFLRESLNNENSVLQEEQLDGQLTLIDKKFLDQCFAVINENISNFDFNINLLCRELAVSRTLLYEKLKSLTGQAPNELIKLVRMEEAARLLKEGRPVQEVAEMVGFSDAKYFSTAFKKHFGVSPSKHK